MNNNFLNNTYIYIILVLSFQDGKDITYGISRPM